MRRFVSLPITASAQPRQGASGLGLEAQQEAVARYADACGGQVTAEFTEVESGKNNARPRLAEALATARAMRVPLIVAKLDRLARDVDFLRQCVREAGDAGVLFCDLPDLPPGAAGKAASSAAARSTSTSTWALPSHPTRTRPSSRSPRRRSRRESDSSQPDVPQANRAQ
jgi:hypothetical protein